MCVCMCVCACSRIETNHIIQIFSYRFLLFASSSSRPSPLLLLFFVSSSPLLYPIRSEAGNLAMRFLARGGVYIAGGGICQKLHHRIVDGRVTQAYVNRFIDETHLVVCSFPTGIVDGRGNSISNMVYYILRTMRVLVTLSISTLTHTYRL